MHKRVQYLWKKLRTFVLTGNMFIKKVRLSMIMRQELNQEGSLLARRDTFGDLNRPLDQGRTGIKCLIRQEDLIYPMWEYFMFLV